jgi:hypothetical protein
VLVSAGPYGAVAGGSDTTLVQCPKRLEPIRILFVIVIRISLHASTNVENQLQFELVLYFWDTLVSRVRTRVRLYEICDGQAALGQVFSEYLGFPCQALNRLLHTHHLSSSGADTMYQ